MAGDEKERMLKVGLGRQRKTGRKGMRQGMRRRTEEVRRDGKG